MFKFGAAFLFSSTLPPKHLLNLKAFPTNQNELIKVFSKGLTRQVYYFLPFPAGAACPGFGRLAPYFERLCVRPATPAVSNVPRTM